jgi:type II secretion system protein J
MARDYTLQRKGLKGFTLLEVLVSVAILAIIMAAVYSAYTSTVEAIQMARENGQVQQMARIVLDQMSKDLESAISELPVPSENVQLGLIGKTEEGEGKRLDRIDFTTLTHITLNDQDPSTDLCAVGYRVVQDSEQENVLVLTRRDNLTPGNDLTEGGDIQEMARNVVEFKITYVNSQGEELDSWNSEESGAASQLPVLIKIRLVLKDGLDREHVFITSIHPEMAGTMKAS